MIPLGFRTILSSDSVWIPAFLFLYNIPWIVSTKMAARLLGRHQLFKRGRRASCRAANDSNDGSTIASAPPTLH